jgi:hypothetical protein
MTDEPDPPETADDLSVVTCPDCGGCGFFPHDCGEDTCCCADDSDEECDRCGGTGEIEKAEL